jgi:hypothetical protein
VPSSLTSASARRRSSGSSTWGWPAAGSAVAPDKPGTGRAGRNARRACGRTQLLEPERRKRISSRKARDLLVRSLVSGAGESPSESVRHLSATEGPWSVAPSIAPKPKVALCPEIDGCSGGIDGCLRAEMHRVRSKSAWRPLRRAWGVPEEIRVCISRQKSDAAHERADETLYVSSESRRCRRPI